MSDSEIEINTGTSTARRGLHRLIGTEIEELLGPLGPLASELPGFEHRAPQVEMAVAVADAFREGGQLLVEAGTGTGKTLAYLIPAVLSGQKVVISTGTKNLQEQLFYKDLPLLRRTLGVPFTACLMKGRSNYLCLSRFDEFAIQPSFRELDQAEHFDTLARWAPITKTGDRAEIPGFPENVEFWSRLSAKSETCVGKECRDFERCWVTRLRQQATESDIIIVNHHLLFADLLVREGAYGEVLPDYDFLVLDEAHQVEDVATQYFGLTVSSFRVEELARDVASQWEARSPRRHRSLEQVRILRRAAQEFFEAYRVGKDRFRITKGAEPSGAARLYETLRHEMERLAADLKGIPEPDESTVALARRSAEIVFDLERILTNSDEESVSWCESRERSVVLHSSPINVSEMVSKSLLERKRSVILTSATLSIDGSLDYTRKRLGSTPRDQKVLPSPFDFSRQTVLYVPRDMPAPRDPKFIQRVAEEVLALTKASRGRAFVLFTSFANLHATRELVGDRIQFPLLVQGEAPRSELLDRFRDTPGAVLLATSSFWEGVDVVGEQLSCVIIDKLPFAVPGDPLVSSRIDWVESRGGSGFHDYQVPMAILGLKQGLGRLIRSRSDRGVLTLLDSRVLRMGYGERFLASLPPFPLVHRREEAVAFLS
jgi:ATP-dependent DNA helicase DinG